MATTLAAPSVITQTLPKRTRFLCWLWPESGAISPIPALDSLRGLAVLLTVVFHSWYQLPGTVAKGKTPYDYPLFFGRTGVHLFFVLSGFLLFLPYAKWIANRASQPSVMLFYKRRILRVGPAYWVSLLILMAFGPYTLSALVDFVAHVFFAANAHYTTVFSVNGVYWTMAIEVQFYVILPLLARALKRLCARVGMVGGFVLVNCATLLVSIASIKIEDTSTFGHISVVSTLLLGETSLTAWIAVFMMGVTIAMLYTTMRVRDYPRWLRVAGGVLAPVSMCLGLGLAFAPIRQSVVKHIGFGVIYGLLLLGVLTAAPPIKKVFEWRVLRFVGLISYSVYIWHLVVIEKIDRFLPQSPLSTHILARLVIGGLLSILVAYVSYQFVERPFIRVRQRAHESE